jgi:hypothetical protein
MITPELKARAVNGWLALAARFNGEADRCALLDHDLEAAGDYRRKAALAARRANVLAAFHNLQPPMTDVSPLSIGSTATPTAPQSREKRGPPPWPTDMKPSKK